MSHEVSYSQGTKKMVAFVKVAILMSSASYSANFKYFELYSEIQTSLKTKNFSWLRSTVCEPKYKVLLISKEKKNESWAKSLKLVLRNVTCLGTSG